jgi:hypothetical protein
VATLEDAGLSSYPFDIVPPTEPTSVWADRKDFRKQLNALAANWEHNPKSGLYLMWAELGAGKTHALRYLQGLTEAIKPPGLAIYCDIPEATGDFKGVYVQAVSRIPEGELATAIYKYRQTLGEASWLSAPLLRGDRDTPSVLWILAEMNSQMIGNQARRWLRGERLSPRELTALGVTGWIKSGDQAVRVMSTVCFLLGKYGSHKRLVLMFDEFQRVGQLNQKRIRDVNAGISSLYNSCPEHLTIILSYSFGAPENIKYMVTGEVLSRVKGRLELPALKDDDATTFVIELLKFHSLNSKDQRVFTDEAVEEVISRLKQDTGGALTPRKLMQACGGILDRGLTSNRSFPLSKRDVSQLYEAPVEDQFFKNN